MYTGFANVAVCFWGYERCSTLVCSVSVFALFKQGFGLLVFWVSTTWSWGEFHVFQVLEVDRENMIARVEPLVNMGQITRMTVPMGLSLAVVAELDDLTVGGLINGYGIEGSSHLYGLFADTCVAYEIILADGRLVRCTADNEFKDLFYAIPWSQGTLGLLVAAEIKLIEVGPYMRVTYTPIVGNLQEIAQGYNDSYCPRDGDQDNPEKVPDFVEGMVYSETESVTMTGRYVSKEEAKRKGNTINTVRLLLPGACCCKLMH